ncbi:MAG: FkbM family methyltransferase [Candidatus ainarchaeum sp.]|nr:FkbM family methyltransferase [Candidatus ainarchaeum sp.]
MKIKKKMTLLIAQNLTLRKIYNLKYSCLHFFGSHSQHREDIVIDKLLGNKKNGFYVDIGANNPTGFNNTKRFYEKGWSGINIEPNVRGYKLFLKERKRDINLNIGIGEKEDTITFYEMEPDMLSTFSKKEAIENQKNGYKLVKERKVKILPLKNVLEKYAKGKEIDFFSIDTEGFDLEVLKSNDWKKFKPKIICVEIMQNNRGKKIESFLKKIGFEKVHQNNTNTIYKLK